MPGQQASDVSQTPVDGEEHTCSSSSSSSHPSSPDRNSNSSGGANASELDGTKRNTESKPKIRKTNTRTRFCRTCSFSCKSAVEFSHHQACHTLEIVGAESPRDQKSTRQGLKSRSRSQVVADSKRKVRHQITAMGDSNGPTVSNMKQKIEDAHPALDENHDHNIEIAEENSMSDIMQNGGGENPVIERGDSEEEAEDEPDAMASASKNETVPNGLSSVSSSEKKKTRLDNGVNGSHSGDEDMDDEDRLVIDDENNQRRLLRKRKIENGFPDGLTETDSGSREQSYTSGVNDSVNICNNFLGVTPQTLNGDGAGAGTATPFDVDNEDDEEDDAEVPGMHHDSTSSLVMLDRSLPLGLAPNDMDTLDRAYEEDKRKKKKTRQEVDPGKYFEAVDSAGTKYACSQCGNIYKWRKSLNKHWKEKHSQDPLVDSPTPPGMMELLKSGKYTQLGSRRIYDNNFLATIKTQKDDSGNSSASSKLVSAASTSGFHLPVSAPTPNPSSAKKANTYGQQLAGSAASPTGFLTLKQVQAATASRLAASVASLLPNSMGRFAGQPVFPSMMFPLPHPFQQQQQQAAVAAAAAAAAVAQQQNGFTPQEEGALDLTRDSKPASRINSPSLPSPQPGPSNGRAFSPEPDGQDQPLDFSKKSSNAEKPSHSTPKEENEKKSESQSRKEHNCSRSDVSSTPDTEFANHQATHQSKRIVRCNECDLQFRSMDDLNTHFMRFHSRKLNEHKEAIKKIPHGLQQTYHLLNMDLRDIGELGNQDLGASDSRSLKCNKCDFEAKWPAELQKHAVSHSEERPYVCMVCGSTYKWKWDLVKHFQKSHPNLPNPYRRNDKRDSPDCSSEEDAEDPELKRARLMMLGIVPGPSRRRQGGTDRPSPNNVENNTVESGAAAAREPSSNRGTGRAGGAQSAAPSGDDGISVEGIIAATQAGQRVVSSQPNILDDEPATSMERSMAYLRSLPFQGTDPSTASHTSHAAHLAQVVQAAHVAQMAQAAQEMIDRRNRAQRAVQDTVKQRQNGAVSYTDSNTSASSTNGNSVAKKVSKEGGSSSKAEELPYKCTMCNYHARWPSEVTQHMKNHSDSKPYLCPRCDYRSKWKWDVVKHLKRCGGGGINDVIDTTKIRKKELSLSPVPGTSGPPNAVVSQQGRVKKTTPQSAPAPAIILPSVNEDGIQGATVVRQPQQLPQNFLSPILPASADISRPESSASATIDLTMNSSRNSENNNDVSVVDNNVNNNYSAYANGQPNFYRQQQQQQQQAFAMALTPALLVSPTKNSTASSSSTTTSPTQSQSNAPTTPTALNASGTRHSSELWTCPHCPFSTASQAELKRHSGLHSEDKPFKCDVCQYSTRWACDLKKHRKSYNHFPSHKSIHTAPVTPSSISIVPSTVSAPKISQEKSETTAEEERLGPSPGRFKCSQCNVYFRTMHLLIEHRTNEHIGRESAQSSPAPGSQQGGAEQQGEEIDAARIKHPRKAIKQIQCPKCEFVCKSRHTMEKHMAEHEELENSGVNCFYCSAQFRDKDSLLDHLTTHVAFNPGEWETFFMTSDEEDQQLRAVAKAEATASESAIQDKEKKDLEPDSHNTCDKPEPPAPVAVPVCSITSTEERIQKILSEVPKQMSSSSQQKQGQQENKYKCEWCPAQFVSLTAVYKHASQAHPIQLKEQDVGMTVPSVSPVASSTPKTKHNHEAAQQSQTSPRKVYTGEPLEILKQQIADKRNHQLAEKYSEMLQARVAAAATQPPHVLMQPPHINTGVKEESEEGEVPQYNCTKCSFSTPSKSTFLRHSELHGGAMPSKCWFCDYSVDHMQLLYQHMKISHTRKWKALSQDPKYAEAIYRMTLAFASAPQGSNNNDSPPLQDSNNSNNNIFSSLNKLPVLMGYPASAPGDDTGVMDLSSRKGKVEADPSSHLANTEITYKQRTQYLWNGIPINVSTTNVTVQFKCPHCPVRDESVAKACCHVAMSHPPLARLRCRACRHSDNNVQTMAEHCKTHPPHERIVEVLEFKALQVNEADMAQFHIYRAKMFQDLVLANAHSALSANMESTKEPLSPPAASGKLLTCPFCPFKTVAPQDMKLHVPNHSRLARYRCQFCDFSTDIPDIISNHIKVHDPNYAGENNQSNSQSNPSEPPPSSSPEKAIKMEQKGSSEENPEPKAGHSQPGDSTLKHFKLTSGRMRYRCSACPYRTTCKSNIIKHKRQHQHSKRYKCSKCSYSAARAVLLKNHMETHDTVFDCEDQHNDIFCNPHSPNDDFKSDENDENDDADVNDEADMDVDDAEDDDACSDDLNEMDAKAIADLEAKDILEAEAAHKAITSPDNTKDGFEPNPSASQHLNTSFILKQQDQKEQAACTETCDASVVDTKPRLGDETESTGDKSNQANAVTLYVCKLCPYKASTKKAFDTHTSGHGLRKRFLCDFCDWSADQISVLLQHRRLHESEPDYISNVEDEDSVFLNTEFDEGASGEFEAKIMDTPVKEGNTTHSVSALSPPFKLTVVKKSYPCKACPFKTNSKSSFAAHKSMHDSGERFSCPHCTYQARNKGLLQQHEHLHKNAQIDTPITASTHINSSSISPSITVMATGSASKNLSEPSCNTEPFKDAASELPELKSDNENATSDKDSSCITMNSPTNNNCEKSRELSPGVTAVKPTRVYVCQYCEREFEAKHLMIQHEKQHLVGSQ